MALRAPVDDVIVADVSVEVEGTVVVNAFEGEVWELGDDADTSASGAFDDEGTAVVVSSVVVGADVDKPSCGAFPEPNKSASLLEVEAALTTSSSFRMNAVDVAGSSFTVASGSGWSSSSSLFWFSMSPKVLFFLLVASVWLSSSPWTASTSVFTVRSHHVVKKRMTYALDSATSFEPIRRP